MTGTRADIARAEAQAAAAKARLQSTFDQLKLRLNPAVRAREMLGGAKEKGEVLADDALEFAYERPRILTGAGGALLLLILRRPLARMIGSAFARRRPKWDVKQA